MKKAFTLIEVNLAMMIMAIGVLSIVALYALGFRENRQSREDVEATALADSVMAPLVMAISHTNMKWSVFREEFHYPSDQGWADYFNDDGIVSDDPDGMAQGVFSSVMAKLQAGSLTPGVETAWPLPGRSDGDGAARSLSCGLVVTHERDSSVVRIAFRATKLPGTLLSMPVFYTAARFQGDPNQ